MNPATTHARIAAELAASRGDLAEALLLVETALLSAPPDQRHDLEEAREWLEELVPQRPSLVGEA